MRVLGKINRKKVLFVLAAVLILGSGFMWLRKPKMSEIGEKTPVFRAVAVHPETAVITHSYIGQVEAINDTEIVPFISGYIVDIKASGGQNVRRGDVLAVLKQEQYAAQVAAATAKIYAAKADYVNAEIKYKRLKKAGLKAVSATQIDDAKAAFSVAKAQLQQARAEFLDAQTNLNYTYLTAPFSGVIGHISASIGDYVSPSAKALTRLVQFDPIRVVFSITDKEFLQGILHDEKNQIHLQSADGKILAQTGEIKYTANAVDPQTDSLAVYAEFANKEQQLVPNAYVNVLIDRTYNDAVLIEKNLLQMKEDGNYVYTALDGILTLHKLEVIGDYEQKTAAVNNFKAGEVLILDDVDERYVGHKINIEQQNQE